MVQAIIGQHCFIISRTSCCIRKTAFHEKPYAVERTGHSSHIDLLVQPVGAAVAAAVVAEVVALAAAAFVD